MATLGGVLSFRRQRLEPCVVGPPGARTAAQRGLWLGCESSVLRDTFPHAYRLWTNIRLTAVCRGLVGILFLVAQKVMVCLNS